MDTKPRAGLAAENSKFSLIGPSHHDSTGSGVLSGAHTLSRFFSDCSGQVYRVANFSVLKEFPGQRGHFHRDLVSPSNRHECMRPADENRYRGRSTALCDLEAVRHLQQLYKGNQMSLNRFRKFALAIALPGVIGLPLARAAVVNWVGGVSEFWSENGNWSTGSAPGIADDVVIGVLPGTNGMMTSLDDTFSITSLGFTNETVVDTAGFLLSVDLGRTIGLRDGAQLKVSRELAGLVAVLAGDIDLNTTSSLNMAGGLVSTAGITDIDSQSEVFGHGTLNYFQGLSTETSVFINDGHLVSRQAPGAVPRRQLHAGIKSR